MLRTSSRDLWQIHMLKQAHGKTLDEAVIKG